MGKGSKRGSGYGGMQRVKCPNCGYTFPKSYAQIESGNPVCTNRKKCNARRVKVVVRGMIALRRGGKNEDAQKSTALLAAFGLTMPRGKFHADYVGTKVKRGLYKRIKIS